MTTPIHIISLLKTKNEKKFISFLLEIKRQGNNKGLKTGLNFVKLNNTETA